MIFAAMQHIYLTSMEVVERQHSFWGELVASGPHVAIHCCRCSVLRGCQEVEQAALADVIAVRERDPACTAYSSALLYYKGYHALQTHRIAHGLWERGQTVLARSLQVEISSRLVLC